MQANPSKTNELSFTTLIGLEKLYHGGLPGLAKSPIKPRTKTIIPMMKTGLIF